MLRIVFLILMVMMSAYGYQIDTASTTVYKSDFGIYVYGDVVSIENAFILVQAIAKSAEMTTIIALMAAVLLPFMAYQYFTTSSGKQLALNLSFVIPSFLFLNTTSGIPTATMHIEDLRTETNYTGDLGKTYAKIDGIPYPIALITSSISTITDSLMRLFEDAVALTNPNIAGFSTASVGFGSGIGDMLKILTSANLDTTNDAVSSLFARSLTAYTEQCGLKLALANDPDLVVNFKNPKQDLFKAIDPATLGITGNAYTLTFTSEPLGEQTYQCDTFWANNIIAKYGLIADKLRDNINKVTVGNINNSSVITSAISIGSDINDSVVSSEIGKFNAYILNLSARAPISKAFANSAMNISSGQDLANSMTAGLAMGEMQMEGIGRMKWMAEVIPYGFHFMLGIIYSISILIMMVATALGAQKGFMIWKNFTKGLMTFEFIKISLVIINASVNQYASAHAADFLASIGQNPATITSLPYYYHYLANMAGIAGILGVTAIFMIPTMVFSGEVSMAAGAIGSLAGRYKGNDSKTATETSAEEQSKNDAWERELKDKAMLDKMGVSVPAGMGVSDYYAKYKQGAEQANVGWGAYNSGTEAMADAGVSVKGQTMQSISAQSTMAKSTPMSDFTDAGVVQGSQMSGQIKGQSAALSFGSDKIETASKLQAFTQVAEAVKLTESRMNAGLASSDGTLTPLALKSMERKMGFDAAGMAGLGKAEYKDKDGKPLEDKEAFKLREKASAGQSSETPIKDAAYVKQAMDGDNGLNKKYATGVSVGEEAKLAGIKGLGSLNAGDQARYINASENQGMIKAKQTIGDTEATMETANKLKKAGESIGDALERVAKDLGSVKVANGFGAASVIDEVGLNNARTLSSIAGAAKQDGDFTSTARQEKLGSDGNGAGGARGFARMMANKQVDDTVANMQGEIAEKKRNSDGTLTEKGADATKNLAQNKASNELRSGSDRYTKEQAERDNAAYIQSAIIAESMKLEKENPNMSAEDIAKTASGRAKDLAIATGLMNADGSAVFGGQRAGVYGAMAAGNVFGVAKGTDAHGNTIGLNSGAEGSRVSGYEGGSNVDIANKKTSGTKNDSEDTDISGSKTKMGDSFTNDQDRLQKTIAFNMHQVAHGHSDKQIKHDKATGKFAMPDKETEQEFKDFVGNADLVNQTLKNVTSETLGEVADALGMSPTAVVGTVGGTALALGGAALGKQLGLSSNKSVVDKTNNKGNNATTNHVDSQHGNSFSNDIRNYTEEYGVSKGKFNAEARNLEGLEAQRANLKDGDTRASKLDNQIEESKKSMAKHQHDMDTADGNIKATKYLATKVEPEGHMSHMKSAGKGLLGMVALSTTGALIDEFNPDPNGLIGGTLSAVQNAANFSDSILGGAGDIISGTVKGGARLFTGGDAKGAFFGGLSQAASRVTTSMNEDLGIKTLASGSNTNIVEGYDIGGSSNQSSANTEQTQQFEQIKTEMSQNATSANAKTAQINNQVGNTRMMIEDLGDSIQDDFSKKLDGMSDKMESINKKLTK